MTGLDGFKRVIDTHPLLAHPLLGRMRKGELTRGEFRAWAIQQFHFSVSLPASFAALYARVPSHYWEEKRKLVELLQVEAWGAEEAYCHSLKFRELADFLELDISAMTATPPAAYTSRYLAVRLGVCLGTHEQGSLTNALAVVALGNEYLNLKLFEAYRAAVTLGEEMAGCPLGYFDAHLEDEEADFKIFAGLYDLLPRTTDQDEGVEAALRMLLGEREAFFTSLAADLDR